MNKNKYSSILFGFQFFALALLVDSRLVLAGQEDDKASVSGAVASSSIARPTTILEGIQVHYLRPDRHSDDDEIIFEMDLSSEDGSSEEPSSDEEGQQEKRNPSRRMMSTKTLCFKLNRNLTSNMVIKVGSPDSQNASEEDLDEKDGQTTVDVRPEEKQVQTEAFIQRMKHAYAKELGRRECVPVEADGNSSIVFQVLPEIPREALQGRQSMLSVKITFPKKNHSRSSSRGGASSEARQGAGEKSSAGLPVQEGGLSQALKH
ncbi:MAG: hypothetical protein ACO3A2_03125 [Bdellovibrionia bacterium]